ncbi:MAG: chemotaxis protein CheW [Tepidisphaeraceae bacterium]|jgi:purine-binding chemotaxis protein CheW
MIATQELSASVTPPHDLDQLPHVIVRIKEQQLAISSACVRRLLLMPEVIAVPHSPPEIRGVIKVRNVVIPLLDLRVQFGMPSFNQEAQETVQLLHDREQDHKNWIAELLASVDAKRPFTLARNPHQCKFGKWYDSYKPENQSVAFLSVWRAFDKPHCRIHAIADKVCDLAAKGDYAAARDVITATRNTDLQEMIQLFAEVRAILRETTREVAIVLGKADHQLAVCADGIVAIETLDHDAIQPLSELFDTSNAVLTPYVARRPNSSQVVLVLDSEQLFKRAHSRVPASARA